MSIEVNTGIDQPTQMIVEGTTWSWWLGARARAQEKWLSKPTEESNIFLPVMSNTPIQWSQMYVFFLQNGPSWGSYFCLKNDQKYWYLQCFMTKVGLKPLF